MNLVKYNIKRDVDIADEKEKDIINIILDRSGYTSEN